MKVALSLGGLLLMVACAAVPPAASEEEVVPVFGQGNCDAAPAQGLLGRTATTELGAEALRLTRAKTLRWIPLGTAVTMDYRTDRLNIELNTPNRVTAIRCG